MKTRNLLEIIALEVGSIFPTVKVELTFATKEKTFESLYLPLFLVSPMCQWYKKKHILIARHLKMSTKVSYYLLSHRHVEYLFIL
jgi:hypothetical protein